MAQVNNVSLAYEKYSHGVRVLMLIDRSIGNTNKGSKRWLRKLISYNEEQFEKNLNQLIEVQNYLNNPNIRLYVSVNKRNPIKAKKLLHHKMIDLQDTADKESEVRFYCNIHTNFVSCLMKPECRTSSNWIVDIDINEPYIVDTIKSILSKNFIVVYDTYSSIKGYHVITSPFNPALLDGIKNVEIKNDGLMLVRTI